MQGVVGSGLSCVAEFSWLEILMHKRNFNFAAIFLNSKMFEELNSNN